MKKITYICDKCKKEISGEVNEVLGYDLCDECLVGARNSVAVYVQGVKPKAPKPSNKIVKHLDTGKAQALRDAGWTVAKIAAELGVSEPTIMKYTTPAKPKKAKPLEWAQSEPDLSTDTRSVMGEKVEEVSA